MNATSTNILSAATTLHTPRMQLKLMTPELWTQFMSQAGDEEMVATLGLYTPEMLELEKAKYMGGMVTYRISFATFLLIDKATGTTIGRAGYHNWYASHSRAEIGYGLELESYKQKGLMTEALKPIIQYGFSHMGLNRIEACASPRNTPSIRLLEGHGFVKEGLLRQHYCKNGIIEDSAIYGLLKSEYKLGSANWPPLEIVG